MAPQHLVHTRGNVAPLSPRQPLSFTASFPARFSVTALDIPQFTSEEFSLLPSSPHSGPSDWTLSFLSFDDCHLVILLVLL